MFRSILRSWPWKKTKSSQPRQKVEYEIEGIRVLEKAEQLVWQEVMCLARIRAKQRPAIVDRDGCEVVVVIPQDITQAWDEWLNSPEAARTKIHRHNETAYDNFTSVP